MRERLVFQLGKADKSNCFVMLSHSYKLALWVATKAFCAVCSHRIIEGITVKQILAIACCIILAGCLGAPLASPAAIERGMSVSRDDFTQEVIVTGANQGVLGAPEFIQARIGRSGTVSYTLFTEQTSADGWLFLRQGYVLGNTDGRRLTTISTSPNCIRGGGCFPKEYVSMSISRGEIERARTEGLTVSLRGSAAQRQIRFSPEYISALAVSVAQQL